MNWSDIDFDNPYVKDIGTYEPPAWSIDDDFFTFDPETTGGIDWSTIYANPDVLSGYADGSGSNLLKNSLKFVSDYAKGSSDGQESQYYAQQKAKDLGLADDRNRGSWAERMGTNMLVHGEYGGYGGYGPMLAGTQAAQSLASMASMNPGMQSLGFNDYAKMAAQGLGKQLVNKALYGINPVLGAVNQFYPGGATEAFKDVTKFAGGVGKTISSGIGTVVKPIQNFLDGIFCDERLKVDIAPLESTEVNDELAQMAFFVKGLRECS